jgi:hypothetical protein
LVDWSICRLGRTGEEQQAGGSGRLAANGEQEEQRVESIAQSAEPFAPCAMRLAESGDWSTGRFVDWE